MVLAHKKSHQDQWSKIGDPDMNPCKYSHLIFNSCQKHMMEKRQPLQQMLLGKLDICL
jgi:hypothetical protein